MLIQHNRIGVMHMILDVDCFDSLDFSREDFARLAFPLQRCHLVETVYVCVCVCDGVGGSC